MLSKIASGQTDLFADIIHRFDLCREPVHPSLDSDASVWTCSAHQIVEDGHGVGFIDGEYLWSLRDTEEKSLSGHQMPAIEGLPV